ncbi:MAG: site-specific integrase [Bacilli bacterium]|nr:site-specific integrase [Bacilli bacterium]
MPVYQNKKTKKWKFRTYAEDVYGNHKQFERKWFDTKKEALQAEREFKLSDRSEISNLLFSELWTVYKEHISLKLKQQSYRSVVSRFNNYILPYFKDYRLNKITNSVYIKWQRIIEEKGFKHKYNSSLHGAMVTILNYAMKFYGLKQNIASMTGNFKRKTDLKRNVDFWTYEEYQTFISVVEDQVYKTFFETLYYTGLRQGECLALTWNDFINDTLDIHKTISKEKKDGKYILNTPKTLQSIRKVKIDKDLVLQLQELKKFYQSCVGFEDN